MGDLIDTVLNEMDRKSESGEISSSPDKKVEAPRSPSSQEEPPFPRYSTDPVAEAEGKRDKNSAPGAPACRSSLRGNDCGPVPEKGTPQDRFAATIGRLFRPIETPAVPAPSQYPGHLDIQMAQTPGFAPDFYDDPTPMSRSLPLHSAQSITTYPAQQVYRSGSNPPAAPPGARPISSILPMAFTPGMRSVPSSAPAAPSNFNPSSSNTVGQSGGRRSEFNLPTSRLSSECQKRHFNPQFRETVTADGRYMCSVTLKSLLIQTPHTYASSTEAKMAIAERALKEVRKSGPNGPPEPLGTVSNGRVLTSIENRSLNDTVRRQEELRQQLLQRSQARAQVAVTSMAAYGPAASSGVDMNNPSEARAFVEGYKMGQLEAQRQAAAHDGVHLITNSGNAMSALRDRSHSPKGGDLKGKEYSSRYRHRSPSYGRLASSSSSTKIKQENSSSPTRHYYGTPHDPNLPNSDRYRPGGGSDLRHHRDSGRRDDRGRRHR